MQITKAMGDQGQHDRQAHLPVELSYGCESGRFMQRPVSGEEADHKGKRGTMGKHDRQPHPLLKL